MNRFSLNKNLIQEYLLALIAFTFPFSIHLNTWIIIITGVYWLFSGGLIRKLRKALSNLYVIFLAVIFLSYLISGVLSDNQQEGLSVLERHASLIALPLLLSATPNTISLLRRITMYLVLGILSAFMVCFVSAAYKYMPDASADVFFYHALTSVLDFNAVYMSALCVISLQLLLHFRKELHKLFVICSGLLIIVFLFLLSSKMMLFVLLVGLIVFSLYNLPKRTGFIITMAAFILTLSAVFFVPQLNKRLVTELDTKIEVVKLDTFRYDTPLSGTSLRLVLWKLSGEILHEKDAWITGVKTGDFQGELNKKYRQRGLYTGNPELGDTGYLGYGPHNMYVEILLSLGIIVLLLFIAGWLGYGATVFSEKNILGIQVFILYTLFFFTESVLSTNKGLVPFVYFSVLFIRPGLGLSGQNNIPRISKQNSNIPLDYTFNKAIKRFADIVFSLIVVVTILSWLLPLLALLIKLISRGPVFFIQKRSGKDNVTFSCIKLRSMYVNEGADRRQAVANDPRITPVGKLIRKLSLDELPQFLNVLAGSMSVIGPRPHMLQHTEDYSRLVDNYMDRLRVKPGITGLSQVMGYRGEIKNKRMIANRVRLDVFYTEKWSPGMDLYIALKTLKLLLVGEGKNDIQK